jgi:glycosyltransferase involved in cell wall biosynthesis
MRDTVLVVNARVIPRKVDTAYIYGVVQHALRVAEILTARGHRVGFILYERDETLVAPELFWHRVFDRYPALTVRFHYGMEPRLISTAFRDSLDAISREWRHRRPPLVYYQTSALLAFAPHDVDIMVTHHGPFVTDVVESIGLELAVRAFEWDHAKIEHLAAVQRIGLDVVRANRRIICAEISPIQVRRLCREGVAPERVMAITQPVECPVVTGALPDALQTALALAGPIVVTAVSRLDQFKNVELFVRGCSAALQCGHVAAALVVGGSPVDPERDRLVALVPEGLRNRVHFHPRISHESLAGNLFHRLAGRGVFVCSSRFDLVPYTVLEAARAGLCTIVPDLSSVGAREYLPEPFRFPATEQGLAAALVRVSSMMTAFAPVAAAIRRATDDAAFLAGFRQACACLPGTHARPYRRSSGW